MKKLITITIAMMLLLTACGSGASTQQTEHYAIGPDAEYDAMEKDYSFKETTSPLEGTWRDEVGIMELVVDGNKAVLFGTMIGTVNGMNIDFPKHYKKTEAEFIDGDLYLTVTPMDEVLEDAGVPLDHTITTKLIKVEEGGEDNE